MLRHNNTNEMQHCNYFILLSMNNIKFINIITLNNIQQGYGHTVSCQSKFNNPNLDP